MSRPASVNYLEGLSEHEILDARERRNLWSCAVLGLDYRRLLFARWLLWTGRIDEGLRPPAWGGYDDERG